MRQDGTKPTKASILKRKVRFVKDADVFAKLGIAERTTCQGIFGPYTKGSRQGRRLLEIDE